LAGKSTMAATTLPENKPETQTAIKEAKEI
jgi:hypothetical protein